MSANELDKYYISVNWGSKKHKPKTMFLKSALGVKREFIGTACGLDPRITNLYLFSKNEAMYSRHMNEWCKRCFPEKK